MNLELILVILALLYLYSVALFVVIRYFKTVLHSHVSILTKTLNFSIVIFLLILPYFQTGSLVSSYLIVNIPLAVSLALYPFSQGLREDGITVFRMMITPSNLLNVLGKFIAYKNTNHWTLTEEEKYITVRFSVHNVDEDKTQEVLFEKERKEDIIELLERKGITIRVLDNQFF